MWLLEFEMGQSFVLSICSLWRERGGAEHLVGL